MPLEQSGLGAVGNTPSSAPLPSGTTPNPPNLGSGAEKNLEKEGRAPAGSQEWDNDSATSEWDSSDLGANPGKGHSQKPREYLGKVGTAPTVWIFGVTMGFSPRFWAEIPAELQGLPRSELQSYRTHLVMELLWIQQAIASRKNVRGRSCLFPNGKDGLDSAWDSVFQRFGWNLAGILLRDLIAGARFPFGRSS